ncbi:hypothetical protein Cma02nite_34280 [Cellulomonas marina]|nr:hypothetical protein Cma02nite_34280 [Cellulomonas marina]
MPGPLGEVEVPEPVDEDDAHALGRRQAERRTRVRAVGVHGDPQDVGERRQDAAQAARAAGVKEAGRGGGLLHG